MAKEAATKGDEVSSKPAEDIHNCTIGNTVVPSKCTFSATIDGNVSANVFINGKAAAAANSVASERVMHTPSLPSNASKIDPEPSTSGTITGGSQTVSINSRLAARHGDDAECCTTTGTVIVSNAGTATVFIGD